MNTISFRTSEDESKLIKGYAKANNLSLSDFIKTTILETIEDKMEMSAEFTEELLQARNSAKTEKLYSHEEAWAEILGE